jgi:hypothetical protein
MREARVRNSSRFLCRRLLSLPLSLPLFLLLGLTLGSGCFASVASRCPGCVELSRTSLASVPPDAQRLFILIPGLLGYGHEWNAAQIELLHHPEIAVQVYSWEPWRSVARSGNALAQVLSEVDRSLPPGIRDVTVIAHSAAGMIAVEAAGSIRTPLQRPLRIVAVGAPLAGLGFYPEPPNLRNTPLPMVLGGRFTEWPKPQPGVRIDVFPTSADDPVMRRIGGHDPADPRVLPTGARLEHLPPELGHNNALGWLCHRLLHEDPPERLAAPEAGR